MKSNKKWLFGILILLLVGGVILLADNISSSLKISDSNKDFSIEIVKDEHVVPFEKVYIQITGQHEKFSNISLVIGNDKSKFKVNLLDLGSEPYFELPYYNDNVVVGSQYYIQEATIKYDDGKIVRYTNSQNSALLNGDNNYFVVDEISKDADAWRGFKGLDFSNYTYTNGNIYFKINGDISEMVDIELDFVSIDEKKSFKADVEGFGNRIFFDISKEDVKAGEEYYIKSMTIYYNNGGVYSYNADNYANILNNRIFITNVIESKKMNITDSEIDKKKNTVIKSKKRENDVFGGFVVLFLIIVAALVAFYFIKVEDD